MSDVARMGKHESGGPKAAVLRYLHGDSSETQSHKDLLNSLLGVAD